MIAKRKRPPVRNETAALRTGDSTDARKRALIGPWMEIKKPAATMTRTGSKRISIKWGLLILNRLFPALQRCLKFGFSSAVGAFRDQVQSTLDAIWCRATCR